MTRLLLFPVLLAGCGQYEDPCRIAPLPTERLYSEDAPTVSTASAPDTTPDDNGGPTKDDHGPDTKDHNGGGSGSSDENGDWS